MFKEKEIKYHYPKGRFLFVVLTNDIPLANSTNISYSALFADDLEALFFKKPRHIKNIIKSYLESLVSWFYKWRLKMNASKCCFTIFSKSGKGSHKLDLFPTLNGDPIPYNPNPVFLGIMFDESLCFKTHFFQTSEPER